MRGKKRKEKTAKSQVNEHTIEVYLNFSCSIHADVNKRQIKEGKNSSDKIEEKRRGNIPLKDKLEILNSGSAIKPQSLKENGPYLLCWRTVFSPSAI